MKLQYIITERIYDSYLDLLHYEFNSSTDEIYDNIPISIVLINDILVRISTKETYISVKRETLFKDILISFAKESFPIDKEVIGIGCNDFFRFYFLRTEDYKRIQKKEVNFNLFFWIMRLSEETIYSPEYQEMLSFSHLLQHILISDKKIYAGMVLERKNQEMILKPYNLEKMLLKLIKQKNQSKTHI